MITDGNPYQAPEPCETYRQPGSNVFQTIGDYAWLWFPLGSIVVNLSLLAWMAWNVIEKLLGH